MLSDEQIENLNYISMNRLDYEIFEIDQSSVKEFARAIEAEVRKQDTELIQQMLYVIEAWERGCEYDDYWRDRDDSITAARKRLEN